MSDIPPAAIEIIKRFEGIRLKTYRCPSGVLTIGVGHTAAAGAPIPVLGMTISAEDADWILMRDLRDVANRLRPLIDVELGENQWAALLAWAFNCGVPAFETSDLRERINAGDFAAVPAQLARWSKGTVRGVKQVVPGLVARRAAEAELWCRA